MNGYRVLCITSAPYRLSIEAKKVLKRKVKTILKANENSNK